MHVLGTFHEVSHALENERIENWRGNHTATTVYLDLALKCLRTALLTPSHHSVSSVVRVFRTREWQQQVEIATSHVMIHVHQCLYPSAGVSKYNEVLVILYLSILLYLYSFHTQYIQSTMQLFPLLLLLLMTCFRHKRPSSGVLCPHTRDTIIICRGNE
jgi:hypothetical protein